jgi:hypothetical protein
MTKHTFAILIPIFFSISAVAQEILTTPAYNPAVSKQYELKVKKSIAQSTEAVSLPFYDDFSVISVFPSAARWADSSVFINTDYAKFPPSIGVATLDALDKKGKLYAGAGPNPFEADNLTSLPLRLDSILFPIKRAISRKDSVFLSFYYQPQGRTISPPSKKATLLLEFHSPGDNDSIFSETDTLVTPHWREKWSTEGGIQVDTFAGPDKKYFRRILIPITGIVDSALYYKKGFQFRFRNIAALKGNSQPDWQNNGSHWNIDVVYLNYGRKISDTIMEDVAFADLAPSMLVNYEAMPFRQYNENFINEMKDTLDITIANLDNKNRNRTYKYEVRKNSFAFPIRPPYNGEPYTVSPYSTDGYVTYKPWARPFVNVLFPYSNDKNIVFHIIHSLTPDPNPLFRPNDTIRFTQVFSNYYAYDNGTAEAGIGLNNAVGGSYAIQFKLNMADTLRGMQIYFNPVIGGTNQKLIDLQVWNDANGKPGQIIKTLGGVTPLYSSTLNEFTSYWFEEPLVIDPSGFPGLIFYIGWTQSTIDNLNVGFDRYKDSHTKRFYNVTGLWQMSDSINYGSLLFRPVIGEANPLGVAKPSEVEHLSIQPNPVTDGNLIIRLPETWTNSAGNNLDISIISATGGRVLSGTFYNPVNVSNLSPGFYMVILTDKNSGRKATGKLIIR